MMSDLQKLLFAGTILAGAVALGPGTAAASPSGALVQRPAVLLAQADTRDHADADKADARRRERERGAKAHERGEHKDAANGGAYHSKQEGAAGKKADKGAAEPAAKHPAEKPSHAAKDEGDRSRPAGKEERREAKPAENAPAAGKKAERGAAEPAAKHAAERPPHAAKDEGDRPKPAAKEERREAKPAENAPAAARPGRPVRDEGRTAHDRGQDHDRSQADQRNDRRGADDRGHDQAHGRDHDSGFGSAGGHDQRNGHDQDHSAGRDDHDHGFDQGPDHRTEVRAGNRTIIRSNGRVIVRHDDTERLRRHARDVKVVSGPGGTRTTTIVRPNGVRVITTEDSHGRLLRRVREQNGRRVVLVENRPDVVVVQPVRLPPLRLTIPRASYIVEADRAPPAEIEQTLLAPPVETVERRYTLDEVLQNERLREKVRRIDLSTITFATGSWDIPADQVGRLAEIGRAIAAVVRKNPDAVFLIGGHTDAVGSPDDNLTLSDHRAESVAAALTDSFGVPPENLVTQGYGEEFLKVQTEGAEQANRRVTIRNITPLLQQARR
jgi:outer membrane protein OmpA-like peptidoglycan-associated protein